MAKELNIQEYIKWRMQDDIPATIRNCHTMFLSGAGPKATDMDEKFVLAKQNLLKLPLVGIVDRYDESMVVFEWYLEKFFKNIDLSYIRRNVTYTKTNLSAKEKADELLKSLDQDLQQLVLEKNSHDMELYRLANQLLDTKISKINNFEKKLNNFKLRCNNLAKNIKVEND